MDDLEAAEAYRREAEFYKEKAEENIRYKYLYLRLGGEMYEVLEILRRTPCACAPLQEAESRLRQMLEQADEDDCQKGVYDFFRKKKGRPPVDKLFYIAEYEGRTGSGQILYLIRRCITEFEQVHGKINLEEELRD